MGEIPKKSCFFGGFPKSLYVALTSSVQQMSQESPLKAPRKVLMASLLSLSSQIRYFHILLYNYPRSSLYVFEEASFLSLSGPIEHFHFTFSCVLILGALCICLLRHLYFHFQAKLNIFTFSYSKLS